MAAISRLWVVLILCGSCTGRESGTETGEGEGEGGHCAKGLPVPGEAQAVGGALGRLAVPAQASGAAELAAFGALVPYAVEGECSWALLDGALTSVVLAQVPQLVCGEAIAWPQQQKFIFIRAHDSQRFATLSLVDPAGTITVLGPPGTGTLYARPAVALGDNSATLLVPDPTEPTLVLFRIVVSSDGSELQTDVLDTGLPSLLNSAFAWDGVRGAAISTDSDGVSSLRLLDADGTPSGTPRTLQENLPALVAGAVRGDDVAFLLVHANGVQLLFVHPDGSTLLGPYTSHPGVGGEASRTAALRPTEAGFAVLLSSRTEIAALHLDASGALLSTQDASTLKPGVATLDVDGNLLATAALVDPTSQVTRIVLGAAASSAFEVTRVQPEELTITRTHVTAGPAGTLVWWDEAAADDLTGAQATIGVMVDADGAATGAPFEIAPLKDSDGHTPAVHTALATTDAFWFFTDANTIRVLDAQGSHHDVPGPAPAARGAAVFMGQHALVMGVGQIHVLDADGALLRTRELPEDPAGTPTLVAQTGASHGLLAIPTYSDERYGLRVHWIDEDATSLDNVEVQDVSGPIQAGWACGASCWVLVAFSGDPILVQEKDGALTATHTPVDATNGTGLFDRFGTKKSGTSCRSAELSTGFGIELRVHDAHGGEIVGVVDGEGPSCRPDDVAFAAAWDAGQPLDAFVMATVPACNGTDEVAVTVFRPPPP